MLKRNETTEFIEKSVFIIFSIFDNSFFGLNYSGNFFRHSGY